jgi:hypothetical protein
MIAKNLIYGLVFTAASTFAQAHAQSTVISPREHFGFNIGDDYQLATYTQTEAYFKKLASSNRTKLIDIGTTEEGRHQYMLVVSSPENIKKLEQYKKISQQLARAENMNDAQAKALAAQGKPVVWIDGGLHATETVGAHQLIETAYQLVSRTDAETTRILDNTIILLVHCNPDGQELVSNWYMRNQDVTKRDTRVPVLYQKYIGHDNNRDFYMMNMKETQNMSRQQYVEWMPQIVYNHHQTGPAGTVVAGPPYRDPFNYNYDPLVITSLDGVGAAMNNRLNAEGKPGYSQRAGSVYSTWWNGGLRTTPYFHNMIGILTEIIGSPTPSSIPLVPDRLIPNGATPNPVMPQEWHFRQSIDYSVSLNYAVLNHAVNEAPNLLFNIYKMGKNGIERGQKDNWTLSPKRVAALKAAVQADQQKAVSAGTNASAAAGIRAAGISMKYFDAIYKNPELRDARAYVLPADQADFPTAVKFINALVRSGILVHQASANFSIAGKNYPKGSYVVKTDQAFRPHVLDMFEPQDHPNDFQYPGGPPVRPYDMAGWTLAFQMGVKFDRILDQFEAPLQRLEAGKLQSPAVQQVAPSANGYYLSPAANNTFIAVNDLLKAGIPVSRTTKASNNIPAGTFHVPAKGYELLKQSGQKFGTIAMPAKRKPGASTKIAATRIALFDQYGGSMPSGWVRWIMEQFHYPFDVVFPQDINKGDLNARYDVILFIDGGIPLAGPASENARNQQPKPEEIPAQYQRMLGSITAKESIPQLKAFLEKGGNIVAVGSSTNLVYHLGLPVQNALVETKGDKEVSLPGDKFYIPGSILKVQVDNTQPSTWGMEAQADIVFDNSPVFKLGDAAKSQQIRPLAWYGDDEALRSGWAWGQQYLKNGVAAFVAPVGKGKLFAYGPEITFRAQAHGTFKLLFNELYRNK